MKKIINPWTDIPGYDCFGCQPLNEKGVKMQFWVEADEIVSIWKPESDYQGWLDTLHGGIQATLCDEIASWVIFYFYQTTGVTSSMEMRYRKPTMTTEPYIILRAKVVRERRNIVDVGVKLFGAQGDLRAECTCVYFTQPHEKAVSSGMFTKCVDDGVDVTLEQAIETITNR